MAGYELVAHGALVDWDELRTSAGLSSTQVACVDLARGLAVLERSSGPSPTMGDALATAFSAVLADLDRTAAYASLLTAHAEGRTGA